MGEDEIDAILEETKDEAEPLDESGKAWAPQEKKENTSEVPDSVKNYIKDQKSKGVPEDKIRAELIKQGWEQDIIEKAFLELTPKTNVSNVDNSIVEKELNLLKAKIEKIETSLDAEKELRKNNAERFERLSERIGNLTESQRDLEKETAEVRTISEKAKDIVENLEPTKIEERLQKRKARIEELATKLNTNSDKIDQLRSEIKDIIEKMSRFLGIEELDKMKDEVKADLRTAKELQAKVEKDANKVEDMFYEVENKHKEITELKSKNKELENEFKKIQKEFDDVRIKQEDVIRRKDFDDFKSIEQSKWSDLSSEIGNLRKQMQDYINDIHDIKTQIHDLKNQLYTVKQRDNYFTDTKRFERLRKEFDEEVKRNEKDVTDIHQMIAKLHEDILNLKTEIRDAKRGITRSKIGLFKKKEEKSDESYNISKSIKELNESVMDLKDEIRDIKKPKISPHWEKWIKRSLAKGLTPKEIKEYLDKKGYNPKIIDEYLEQY